MPSLEKYLRITPSSMNEENDLEDEDNDYSAERYQQEYR